MTLFAFSPLSLIYSTDGRMYSLLLFFTLGSVEMVYRLHSRGANPATLVLWVLAAVGGLLTHYYYFFFVWAAFVAWILLFPGRARRVAVVAAVSAVAVLIAPWYTRLPEILAYWRGPHAIWKFHTIWNWSDTRTAGHHLARAMARLTWSYFSPKGFCWGKTWLSAQMLVKLLLPLLIMAAFGLTRWRSLARRRVLLLWLWLCAALLGPLSFVLLIC